MSEPASWDDAYERTEETKEFEKFIKMQVEFFRTHPEVMKDIQAIHTAVINPGIHAQICDVCRHKRQFVMHAQTLAILMSLAESNTNYVRALDVAMNIPATRLYSLKPLEAATELLIWYVDQASPVEHQRGIPQPGWVSDSMERDGHE